MRFLLPARQEFLDAMLAYDSVKSGLGGEFRAAVREAVARIQAYPQAWHRLDDSIRRCLVRRFPYAIIYAHDVDDLLVIAVAHMRREPSYWRTRK